MDTTLNDLENEWANKFIALTVKKPTTLRLMLDVNGCDGNIEIFSPRGKTLSRAEKNWINKLDTLLDEFPDSPDFWLLSNIDGWSVGKGQPAFYSGTTVGTGGAVGSLSDDFSSFYVYTTEIAYEEIDEEIRDESEVRSIKSNRGNLTILTLSQ